MTVVAATMNSSGTVAAATVMMIEELPKLLWWYKMPLIIPYKSLERLMEVNQQPI